MKIIGWLKSKFKKTADKYSKKTCDHDKGKAWYFEHGGNGSKICAICHAEKKELIDYLMQDFLIWKEGWTGEELEELDINRLRAIVKEIKKEKEKYKK